MNSKYEALQSIDDLKPLFHLRNDSEEISADAIYIDRLLKAASTVIFESSPEEISYMFSEYITPDFVALKMILHTALYIAKREGAESFENNTPLSRASKNVFTIANELARENHYISSDELVDNALMFRRVAKGLEPTQTITEYYY